MFDNTEFATGYDAQFHFRAPSDFIPLVHLAARRQGMSASSFIRFVVNRELERLGVSYATAPQPGPRAS